MSCSTLKPDVFLFISRVEGLSPDPSQDLRGQKTKVTINNRYNYSETATTAWLRDDIL